MGKGKTQKYCMLKAYIIECDGDDEEIAMIENKYIVRYVCGHVNYFKVLHSSPSKY